MKSVLRLSAVWCALLLAAATSRAQQATTRPLRTFCNPLDLDYGIRDVGAAPHRHGADPVIVLYRDRYYLFSTWDRAGYRASDDLAIWTFIPFADDVGVSPGNTYTAAAVVERDGWLYFTEFGTAKKPVGLYRTRDPDSGKWEKVSEALPPYADPCLFVDPTTKRLFMYHGLERPIRGVELDARTFAELPSTQRQLMDRVTTKPRIPDGWEVCTWDHSEASPGMRGNKTFVPCREGAWMTFHNGKYHLQYASPGTTVPGYADGLLIGDSPLGPFTHSPFSPISQKDSGFITSAGHGCLFQDRHGNWWRAVTMLIGVHHVFERRIGLFPAGFDADGIPYTRTDLGDLPITLPDGPSEHARDAIHAGWHVLSDGVAATSSSSLDDEHRPERASDEDVRTWWSARSGDAGEWLQLDLGETRTLRAVQVNLFEQDHARPTAETGAEGANRYTLAASTDGTRWTTIVERARSDGPSPHAYVQFDLPIAARFLKLTNVRTAGGGKFAVSELRAFGVSNASPPAAVAAPRAARDETDRRKVTLSWDAAEGATGYLVRYGIQPDKLYQHRVLRQRDGTGVTLYSLNHEPGYHFRIDAMNDSGITPGKSTVAAP